MKKFPLVAILLIGVLTPVASTALFFLWRPAAQVNIGDIMPQQPLQAAGWRYADGRPFAVEQWRGDWVLLAAAAADCGEQCRRRLCQMRQLRLMLPGNYLKLRRAWAITDQRQPPAALPQKTDCNELDNPAIEAAEADMLAGVETLYVPPATLPPQAQSYLYLIDPAGIWAMRFPPDLTTYQIRKDLKRLLRISKGRKHIPAPR